MIYNIHITQFFISTYKRHQEIGFSENSLRVHEQKPPSRCSRAQKKNYTSLQYCTLICDQSMYAFSMIPSYTQGNRPVSPRTQSCQTEPSFTGHLGHFREK